MTLIVKLMYVSAQQAQQATTPLLSSGGKIEVLAEDAAEGEKKGAATTLVVSDRKSVVDRVVEVIHQLDKPEPQLNIEVKLVETSLSKENKIGIDWPESYSLLFGTPATETDPGGYLVSHSLDGGRAVWGTFAAANVQTALDVMLKSGNSKLLSTPNLTTVSNRPAEIAITTTIPVQTLNRFTEGAVIQDIVSFQDLDVGISLTVNPIIEEITGYTGPINNQRPITSKREMNTVVRVKDGMTLVMGGLLRESKIQNVSKLPLLGDIPYVGKAFQHSHDQIDKTDLTVFITPKIMPAN
jgi:type II secretory pathway component GspD/PulD (secretin)